MTILGIRNDPDTVHVAIALPKELVCPISGKPCQPDVQFGDQAKCQYWWGGEVVQKKCREHRKK